MTAITQDKPPRKPALSLAQDPPIDKAEQNGTLRPRMRRPAGPQAAIDKN